MGLGNLRVMFCALCGAHAIGGEFEKGSYYDEAVAGGGEVVCG